MTDNTQNHWAAQPERGSRLFLALTTLMVRYLPAFLMRPCIWFVVLYFYATAPKPRRHILRYQTRLQTAFPDTVLPKHGVFKQFIAFGEAICDRFAVWQRKIRYEDLVLEDPDGVYTQVSNSVRGQIFACSHLGNTEVCRALVSHHKGFRLNVLVHSKHAQAFNEALQKAGAEHIRLIQVTDLDSTLMMELNRRIEDGEWIAIAADRVPVRGEKTRRHPFPRSYRPHAARRMALGGAFENSGEHAVLRQAKRPLPFETAPLHRHFRLETRQPRSRRYRRHAGLRRYFGARMRAKSAAMV